MGRRADAAVAREFHRVAPAARLQHAELHVHRCDSPGAKRAEFAILDRARREFVLQAGFVEAIDEHEVRRRRAAAIRDRRDEHDVFADGGLRRTDERQLDGRLRDRRRGAVLRGEAVGRSHRRAVVHDGRLLRLGNSVRSAAIDRRPDRRGSK